MKKIIFTNLVGISMLLSVSAFAQQETSLTGLNGVTANFQPMDKAIEANNTALIFNEKIRLAIRENADILRYKVKLMDVKTDLVNSKIILMQQYMHKSFKTPKFRKIYKRNILLIDEAIKDTESDILLMNELMTEGEL